jgi:hypothetical protein
MRVASRFLAAVILAALVSSCSASSTTLYRWGDYEDLVYDMYVRPGKADPGTQIERLSADIARTEAAGQKVPPGVHAHLGYLYYGQGQLDSAAAEFTEEKILFPESAAFVDGILTRMANQP